MHIDLDQDQTSLLREVLQEKVTELDKQINAADSLRFKDELRETGRTLERILGSLRSTGEPQGPADWEPRDAVVDSEP